MFPKAFIQLAFGFSNVLFCYVFVMKCIVLLCSLLSNILYFKTCAKQYIGETKRQLNECFGEHSRCILNHHHLINPTPVSTHFNQPGHSINDILPIPLELIRHSSLVCRCGFAVITVFENTYIADIGECLVTSANSSDSSGLCQSIPVVHVNEYVRQIFIIPKREKSLQHRVTSLAVLDNAAQTTLI